MLFNHRYSTSSLPHVPNTCHTSRSSRGRAFLSLVKHFGTRSCSCPLTLRCALPCLLVQRPPLVRLSSIRGRHKRQKVVPHARGCTWAGPAKHLGFMIGNVRNKLRDAEALGARRLILSGMHRDFAQHVPVEQPVKSGADGKGTTRVVCLMRVKPQRKLHVHRLSKKGQFQPRNHQPCWLRHSGSRTFA